MSVFDRYLKPDYILDTFKDVTPEFCRKHDIKALICDIDNTLVTYDDPEPTEAVMAWYRSLDDIGVKLSFVSNNEAERVTRFAKPLGVPAFYKSGKPSRRGLRMAVEAMGSDPPSTVLLGDQLLTDVMAAKRFGIRAIVVPPIKDKTTLFFRAKRAIERPFMNKYTKQGAGKNVKT